MKMKGAIYNPIVRVALFGFSTLRRETGAMQS